MTALRVSLPALAVLLSACMCQTGASHAADYHPEQRAVHQAAVELGIKPRLDVEDLAELDVIAVADTHEVCGPKTMACFCQTPLCEQIIIRQQDVGQQRAPGFIVLTSYTLMHEYTHAVLYRKDEHGPRFQAVLRRAMDLFGLKNENEYQP